MKHVPDVLRCPCTESVKYMIVSLFWTLHANPRLLQQIVRDKTAHNGILKTRWTRLFSTWSLPHSCLRSKTNFTFSLKWISTNFPNRLLLLFLTVFAFPKASSKGLAARNRHIPNVVFASYAKIKTLDTTSSKCLWRTYLQQSSHLYLDLFHKMWLNTWN